MTIIKGASRAFRNTEFGRDDALVQDKLPSSRTTAFLVSLLYGWRLGLINSIAGSGASSVARGAPQAESQLCIDPHAVEL